MRILQVEQTDTLSSVLQRIHSKLMGNTVEDDIVNSQNLVALLEATVKIGRRAFNNARHKDAIITWKLCMLVHKNTNRDNVDCQHLRQC